MGSDTGIGLMRIHPTAVCDPRANLADDVEVGPYGVIGPHVTLSPGCVIENHVTITGNTTMGSNCHVHSSSVIGGRPQDLKYKGEETELIIGNNNTIREFVTINAGTALGGGKTVIGDDNLFMAYVHVAHDCAIGNRIVLANVATLGGHIRVEDGVRISGLAAIHHFVTIGRLAFVGGCAKVVRDVPSFMMVDGNPARVRGLNIEGLKRLGIDREELAALKEAYRLLYRSDLNRAQAIEDLRARGHAESAATAELIRFLLNSERGRRGRGREAERSDIQSGGRSNA
jgi:UDP-N-acetylglucosamine acyltransferase